MWRKAGAARVTVLDFKDRKATLAAVKEADPGVVSGFTAAAHWNPAEQPGSWRFYHLRPTRIQAYLGYGEVEGKEVMREGRWLS